MIYQDEDVYNQFVKVFDFYNIRSGQVSLEVNQSPGQLGADYLQARLKVDAELSRAAFKVIQQLLAPRATREGT